MSKKKKCLCYSYPVYEVLNYYWGRFPETLMYKTPLKLAKAVVFKNTSRQVLSNDTSNDQVTNQYESDFIQNFN